MASSSFNSQVSSNCYQIKNVHCTSLAAKIMSLPFSHHTVSFSAYKTKNSEDLPLCFYPNLVGSLRLWCLLGLYCIIPFREVYSQRKFYCYLLSLRLSSSHLGLQGGRHLWGRWAGKAELDLREKL